MSEFHDLPPDDPDELPGLPESLEDQIAYGLSELDDSHLANVVSWWLGARLARADPLPPTVIPNLLSKLRYDNRTGEATRGLLRQIGRPALEALVSGLDSDDDLMVGMFAYAIGSFGADAAALLPRLRDLMCHGPTMLVRVHSAMAVWEISGDARGLAPILMQPIRSSFFELASKAAWYLRQIGPEAAEVVPELIAILRSDRDWTARCPVALTLGAMGLDAVPAIPALIRAIEGSDEYVARDARHSLNQLRLLASVGELILDEGVGTVEPPSPSSLVNPNEEFQAPHALTSSAVPCPSAGTGRLPGDPPAGSEELIRVGSTVMGLSHVQGARSMPIHDWTRVDAGTFEYFHLRWIASICDVLNGGLLPRDYYAMGEQRAIGVEPDVLTGHSALRDDLEGDVNDALPGDGEGGLLVTMPRARIIDEAKPHAHRRKQHHVVIRHAIGDRIVAAIELISRGDRSTRHALGQVVEKAVRFLEQGVHLLIVDVLPPGRFDPQGIHGAIWDEIAGRPYTAPAGQPLTAAAYESGPIFRAYVEPLAVGDPLPDMPLFLRPGRHVKLPLEASYRTTWEHFPQRWKAVLEADDPVCPG